MVWIISQFLKKLLDNVCRDLHPWRSLIAHKWYSVNGYFFLLFIFHCVPSDVSLDCTCIWESLPGYISLLGWDVKFVISVSLKPGVPLSPTHFYDLQADTSDHQSWKSLKDTVDIFHSLTSMPEKMCFMFRPRPAAKLLPAGPELLHSTSSVGCLSLPSRHLCQGPSQPCPGVIQCSDLAPGKAERVSEVSVFENVCVVAQKGKNKCYQKPTTVSLLQDEAGSLLAPRGSAVPIASLTGKGSVRNRELISFFFPIFNFFECIPKVELLDHKLVLF